MAQWSCRFLEPPKCSGFGGGCDDAISLVALNEPITVPSYQFIALRHSEVFAHHLSHERRETGLGRPAEFLSRLRRIPEQSLDLRRAKLARVNAHDRLAARIVAHFIAALSATSDLDPELARGRFNKLAHAMLHTRRDNVIIGLGLLKHLPLHLDIVARVARIPLRVESPEVEAILKAQLDPRQCACGVLGDEGLAEDRPLVVEQDAVARKQFVSLAVVDGDPVGLELGHRVGRP